MRWEKSRARRTNCPPWTRVGGMTFSAFTWKEFPASGKEAHKRLWGILAQPSEHSRWREFQSSTHLSERGKSVEVFLIRCVTNLEWQEGTGISLPPPFPWFLLSMDLPPPLTTVPIIFVRIKISGETGSNTFFHPKWAFRGPQKTTRTPSSGGPDKPLPSGP